MFLEKKIRMGLRLFCMAGLLVLSSCAEQKACPGVNGDVSEVAPEDEELDTNGDGQADYFFEIGENGKYYELSDRNYDGKVDKSVWFDDVNSFFEGSKEDNDHDGIMETELYSDNYLVTRIVSDTDRDELIDVVIDYETDMKSIGTKYYKALFGEPSNTIGTTIFLFNYPYGEETREPTNLTPEEFHAQHSKQDS